MGVPNPCVHIRGSTTANGQFILIGCDDVGGGGGGGGGAFEPGLVCAEAMGSNDIATGAAVNANAATIITTISNVVLGWSFKLR
jgi:hypothetical protein